MVMPSGMVIDSKRMQSWKAPSSIEVTLSGMMMDVKYEQLLKAKSPIDMTGNPLKRLGITTSPYIEVDLALTI